jgi:hypothetical protein
MDDRDLSPSAFKKSNTGTTFITRKVLDVLARRAEAGGREVKEEHAAEVVAATTTILIKELDDGFRPEVPRNSLPGTIKQAVWHTTVTKATRDILKADVVGELSKDAPQRLPLMWNLLTNVFTSPTPSKRANLAKKEAAEDSDVESEPDGEDEGDEEDESDRDELGLLYDEGEGRKEQLKSRQQRRTVPV